MNNVQRPIETMNTLKTFVLSKRFLWLIYGAWVVAMCVLQYRRWHDFAFTSFDLGIYTQVLWNATHGAGFYSSFQGHHYFADHFEPFLFAVWPLFKLWSSPLLLLWIHTLIIGTSIFPLYRLARFWLSPAIATSVAAVFFLHPVTWNIAIQEFHVLPLALPLMLWCAWVYVKKDNVLLWWVVLVCTALIREDMGIVVAGFTLLAWAHRRSWRWWLPPIVIGIVWTLIARSAQGMFVEGYTYTDYFPWLELVLSGQWHEAGAVIWDLLTRFENIKMVGAPVLAFAVVCILGGEWLLPALPTLLSFALIDRVVATVVVAGYHGVVPVAFFWVASLVGLQRLLTYLERKKFVDQYIPRWLVLCIVSVVMLSGWYFIQMKKFFGSPQYTQTDIQQLFSAISPDDGIVTTAAFIPLFSTRSILQPVWYIFRAADEFERNPYSVDPAVSWFILDTNEFLDLKTQREEYWDEHAAFIQKIETDFIPVQSVGSIILFHRRPYSGVDLPTTYTPSTSATRQQIVPDAPPIRLLAEPTLEGHVLHLEFQLAQSEQWKDWDSKFVTPQIVLQGEQAEVTIPLGFGFFSHPHVQSGDSVRMDIALPDKLYEDIQTQLHIRGVLVHIGGLSIGHHQTITRQENIVGTFLDKTLSFQ